MSAKYFLALAFFVVLQAYAGDAKHPSEKPSIHLTGNPQVDFFNVNGIAQKDFAGDTLPTLTQSESNGGEKSPWIAGLLSLAVPGAGEWYTDNKVKGAVFFGVEVAAWVTAYIYNKKGDHQTDVFQDYANTHYSAARYVKWTLNNFSTIDPQSWNSSDYYHQHIFPSGNDSCTPPFPCMDWAAMNYMETDIQHAPNNGYSHQMPHYGDQQYFELIGKYPQFFSGWDDVPLGWSPSDISNGYSGFPQQRMYADMRAQANNYYDIAFGAVSVAVVNHVVSALDAYLSATSYNKSLHAEMNFHLQPTPYGVIPQSTARITYTF